MTQESRGCTIWLTGLSGAGKSTISTHLVPLLKERGCKVEVLDGDIVRTNLSKGLGFSKEDRDTNIRRIGFVCHLLTRNGVFVIAAAISPYRSVREENRRLIKDFVEVYVKASLETCIERDVKGLYKKALAGEIKSFTGVSDPYEPPENPELICDTEHESPAESAQKIIRKLEELGYIMKDSREFHNAEGSNQRDGKAAAQMPNLVDRIKG
ncbi:MAG: adenylyl-sulfate kinase [Calditrichaeota bacterium]|nr:MAG: adenylyl-sulfate kinase [Calditrichota bacterium]